MSRSRLVRPRLTLRRVVLAAVVVFVLLNLAGASSVARQGPAGTGNGRRDRRLPPEQVRDAGYPGAAFAIVRDGRVSHSGGIGRADDAGRRITPETPFVIGSLSKALTATAIMKLVETDEVDLDAAVTTYLPDFAVAGPGAERITIRHLLHHTSGLPTLAGVAPLAHPVTSLAAQVDALGTVRLATEPGMAFAYSSANYEVLGLVVERITGRPFGTYVADELFGSSAWTTRTSISRAREPMALPRPIGSGSASPSRVHRYGGRTSCPRAGSWRALATSDGSSPPTSEGESLTAGVCSRPRGSSSSIAAR